MNDLNATPVKKKSCMPCPIILAVGLLSLVVMYGWVSVIVHKVFNGSGLEHCCVIEGVRFNYIAVFVLLCGIAVALIFAVIIQIRDWFVRRDFEHKHGVKLSSSDRSSNARDSNAGPSFHGDGDGD